MKRQNWSLCTAVAVMAMVVPVSALMAEQRGIWQSLPPETVLALRGPNPARTLEQLQQRTQMGVLFERSRILRLLDVLAEDDQLDLEEPLKLLERVGLERADIFRLIDGPIGFAYISEQLEGRPDVGLQLFWIEPGEQMAGKLHEMVVTGWEDAYERMPEEMREEYRRIDFEVRGVDVMHLVESWYDRDVPHDFWHMPDEFWEWDHERQRQWHQQRQQEYEQMPTVKVQQENTLIARIDGALVVIRSESPWGAGDEGEGDWDQLSGADRAAALIAHLVDARRGEAGAGERDFVSRAMAAPGVRDAMPRGDMAFELLMDVGRMIEVAAAEAQAEREAEGVDEFDMGPDPRELMRQLGFDELGVLAMGASLDGNVMRYGGFLGAPAPRRGIMQLLDQPTVAPQPPAWVPDTVPAYTHFSLDLAQLYETIKEVAAATMGEEAAFLIPMFEQGMQENLGVAPADLLGAVEPTHHMLMWPRPPRDREEDEPTDFGVEGVLAMLDYRMAFVWPVRNEGVLERMFNRLAEMADMGEGPNIVREQGFVGIREGEGEESGALLLGHGHLMGSFGEQTINETQAMLRRRGEDIDALRDSDLYRRAARLIDLRPSVYVMLSDDNRLVPDLRRTIEGMLEDMLGAHQADPWLMGPDVDDQDMAPEQRQWIEQMRADQQQRREQAQRRIERIMQVMPSRQELENAFAVSAGQATVDRHGMKLEYATELPPKR